MSTGKFMENIATRGCTNNENSGIASKAQQDLLAELSQEQSDVG
jgi:hypothetical protein